MHPAMSDKSRSLFIITRRARDESANKNIGNKRNSWSDLPDDGDLGDVPEFPVINPMSPQSPAPVAVIDSRPSTPHIPAELKGKQVEPDEHGDRLSNVTREKLENWFGPQTDYDQRMAAPCRPGSLESEDQLQAAWDDDNRRLPLHLQNMMLRRFQKEARQIMHDQVGHIDELHVRLQELELLVAQSQIREEAAIRKNSELALQGPSGSSTLKPAQPVQPASLRSTPKEKKPPIEESIVDLPANSTHVTLPDLPEEEPTTAQPSMLVVGISRTSC
jgi:hypothetical protein